MTPRCLCWCLGWWRDAAHAQRRGPDNLHGYAAWKEHVTRCFKPVDTFIASGTWSAPEHNPVPGTHVVNAGADWSLPYVGQRTHYAKMAFIAAMAYALNRVKDWDYLVMLDADGLVGGIDIPKLLSDFAARPETLLAPAWHKMIGGPLMVFKPDAAIRLVHHRPYVNFVDDGEPDMPMWEGECLIIYGNRWWNPWPNISGMLQQGVGDEDAIHWPALGRPASEHFAHRYISQHMEKCVTL